MSAAAERFRRVGELFDRAATLRGSERAEFLAALGGDDADLRGELEAMLAADAAPGPLDGDVRGIAAQVEHAHAAAALAGRQIGPWRIVGLLGRGGMGAIWRAERADGAYAQNAALKLIHLGIDSPETRARFLRERQFLASLQHPNIATLLDGGVTAEGTPYLAMELVDGERIDAYCDARRLTVAERLRLMQQVLAAVQHAHQRLIVHRDLKPSNILVAHDGTAKLLDFGIAAVLDASGAAAATRERPHTPGYAAPEQVAGAPLTTAADIYALGVILLRVVGGHEESALVALLREAHGGGSRLALAAAALGADAERIAAARGASKRSLSRTLAGDLDTIVQRALAHDPARRYASAQALSADIDAWLAGRPIQARPDSALYRARMFVRRNRIAVATAAAALLALLGATAFSIEQARRAREAARDAEARALSLRAVSDTFDHLLRSENYLADANGAASAARIVRANLSAIDYFLSDQPLTRASLLWRSGRALRIGGDLRSAVPALQAATVAFRKAGAAASLQGREASFELALALREAGDADAAAATLNTIEQTLRDDEVNIDLHRHALAYQRARLLLDAGEPARAAVQIEQALALAPAPSGERGARYGTTALLAGTIALAQDSAGRAAEHFSDALAALAADPHTALAPPHQPLAAVFETLVRLGDRVGALSYAETWASLRARYYGADSAPAQEAHRLVQRLGMLSADAADAGRAARLRDALAAYWQATFVDYDVTRDQRMLGSDRDL